MNDWLSKSSFVPWYTVFLRKPFQCVLLIYDMLSVPINPEVVWNLDQFCTRWVRVLRLKPDLLLRWSLLLEYIGDIYCDVEIGFCTSLILYPWPIARLHQTAPFYLVAVWSRSSNSLNSASFSWSIKPVASFIDAAANLASNGGLTPPVPLYQRYVRARLREVKGIGRRWGKVGSLNAYPEIIGGRSQSHVVWKGRYLADAHA